MVLSFLEQRTKQGGRYTFLPLSSYAASTTIERVIISVDRTSIGIIGTIVIIEVGVGGGDNGGIRNGEGIVVGIGCFF